MLPMRQPYISQPLNTREPEIGHALWRIEDVRDRTKRWLAGVDQGRIDWAARGYNSVGTLLYHIAAIEIDWMYTEVLMAEWPPALEALLPYPVRDAGGRLYAVTGLTLAQHLARLDQTRRFLLDSYTDMTLDDYRRARRFADYDVTPEWVLHHVIHHESMHFGEMMMVYALAGERP